MKAALDAQNDEPQDGENGRKRYRGETCCMCSKQLPHLGTFLYAADNYSHDDGSHKARGHCEQVCRDQCHWKGNGRFLGCYDEDHIRSVNRQHGWHIWEERQGEIC